MSAISHNRAKAAALSRSRDPNDPELLDARRRLAAAVLEQHVARVVSLAPPLTQEQKSRIASLLSGGGASGDAA